MTINNMENFQNVLRGLFFREMKTRFGKNKFGYIFAILEPIMHISIFSFLFYFIGKKNIQEVPFQLFFTIGFIGWFLFYNTFNKTLQGIESNKGLFFYKQVKPIDILIVRTFIEFILFIFLCLVFFIILYFFNFIYYLDINFLMFFYNSVFLSLFGFLFSVVLLPFYLKYDFFKIFLNIFMRILYFCSALFYPLYIIPNKYLDIILYNPLALLIDNLRNSLFGFDYLEINKILYLLLFIVFLSIFSVLSLKYIERKNLFL